MPYGIPAADPQDAPDHESQECWRCKGSGVLHGFGWTRSRECPVCFGSGGIQIPLPDRSRR